MAEEVNKASTPDDGAQALDLAELKRIAASAFQGEWWIDDRRATSAGALQIQTQHRGPGSSYCLATVNHWERPNAYAAHIVAFQPKTALALLAQLAEARADVEELHGDRFYWKTRAETAEAAVARLKAELANRPDQVTGGMAVMMTRARAERLEALQAGNEKLRAGLNRLGSMEAFTLSRTIRTPEDDELIARIDFARALCTQATPAAPEGGE